MAEEANAPMLHPAEHRAYRELYVTSRQLVRRWGRLISALAGTPYAEVLERGRERIDEFLEVLAARTADYGLHGGIAAQGLGARLADVRAAVTDRSVDTGMVIRLAVLDIEHLATLLGHLAELAAARDDSELAAFCAEWEATVRADVDSTRAAAVSLGGDPDRAAAPLDESLLGRTAHGVGWVFGSVGEAVDRVTGSRGGPREDDRPD